MRYFSLALVTIVTSLTLVLLFPATTQGIGDIAECPAGRICLPNPLGTTATVETLARRIVDWLVLVAAPIAAVMIIYGAFQMLFAGGNPEKFGTGRKTILYAVVGYGIIFVGWGLVSIIEKLLTTNPP
ncbi:MAG: pilin [Candidatus Jorgensenbacteria bacterium]